LGSGEKTAALVLTGDLVHDGSPEAYAYLAEILADTGLPYYCIPGNHDHLDLMETRLGPAAITDLALRRLGDWSLLLLDSNVPGEEGGHLGRRQLERVDGILADAQGPCLVFVHQQPMPIESRWMDAMAIDNGEALLELCARHPQAKGVVFGHVHQAFDVLYGPVRVLGCPSTCVQFLPRSDTFAMDGSTPGYRELLLHPDELLETSVIRLAAYPEPLQLHTEGY
jgi:Icc protein